MAVRPPQIIFGVFKGMGDLLWAVPVIASELSRGNEVHLLLFPSKALLNFCSLVDFGPCRSLLSIHTLPRTMGEALTFVGRFRRLSPGVVWISPHAPAAAASWKIPLALWILKTLFWPSAQIVGATSERLSQTFDVAIPVDRALPLKFREWQMYHAFRDRAVPVDPPLPRFEDEIMKQTLQPPSYDLVIHPGATALNRLWPHSKYPDLIALLPDAWRIAVLGLPEDVEPLRRMLPGDRSIEYIVGSLHNSLMTIASTSLLLAMDSGNVHFAEVLGRQSVAIFGKEDPATIIPKGLVEPIYEKSISCQPCGLAICIQSEPFCLTNLSAATVAKRLMSTANERSLRSKPLEQSTLVMIQTH